MYCECGCGESVSSGSRFQKGHWARLQVKAPVEDRFWALVQKSQTGCWIWTRRCNPKGYGVFSIETGKTILAHRFAWELTNGPIPTGLEVCHHCDNRPCARPDHLFLGTHQENITDSLNKGRFMSPKRLAAIPKGDNHYRRRNPSLRNTQGENSPTARLTWDEVRSIRSTYTNGGITMKELGLQFGVGLANISAIIRNQTWVE